MKLTDADPMPMGKKYRDVIMADVPADYLLWLYDNNKCTPPVRSYVEDNMQALRAEYERMQRSRQKPGRCCDCLYMYEGIYGFSKRCFCKLTNNQVQWRDPACKDFEQ